MSLLRWFWRQLWVTVVMALVLLALYTSVGRQLMPLLETKQTDIEQWLSERLRQPVTMSSIQGGWQGLSPVLEIEGLQIGGEQGLTFSYVSAELNLSATVFYRTPVFERIVVSGTYGQVTQISESDWEITPDWIFHLDDKKNREENNNAQVIADWLLLQQYILLNDIEAQIVTLDRDADSFDLHQLRWRSQGGQHELNVDLAWGHETTSNIRVQAFLDGDLWPWKNQHGRVYVNLEEQDWSSWLATDNIDGVRIKHLQGAAQGWLNVRNGNLESVYLNSNVTKLVLGVADDEFTLSDGTLLMAGKHSNNDWHLQMLPRFAESLPLNNIQLSEISLASQKAWQVGIKELDVQQARELLERYKVLPEKIAYFIDGTAPTGIAKDVRFSILKDQTEDRWKFDVRASLENIHAKAFAGIPKISGINAQLHLQPQAGLVTIQNQDVGLHLPHVFTPTWQVNSLQGDLRWQIFPDHAELQLENAQASLQDNVDTNLSWPFSLELNMLFPRQSDTEMSLGLLVALPEAPIRLHTQLVPDLVGDGVFNWLSSANLQGKISDVVYLLKTGIGADAQDTSLSSLLSLNYDQAAVTYLEEWPRVTDLQGSLYLDTADLKANITSGTTLGGKIRQGQAVLQDGHLKVKANIQGDTTAGFRYFTETPLQDAVGHALDGWKASGEHNTNFELGLSFNQPDIEPQIALESEVKDNSLYLSDLNLSLTHLTGKIAYSTQHSLQSDALEGHVLGGPFKVRLNSTRAADNQLSLVLQGKGNAQWQSFHQWQKISIFEPIQGQLDYDVNLMLSGGKTELQVTSDLLGTTIKLPQPYKKTANQSRSLKVRLEAGTPNILRANYDQNVRAEFALTGDQTPRGQIVLGGGYAQLPSGSGIEIKGSVEKPVVFEEWWASLLEFSGNETNTTAAAPVNEVIQGVDLLFSDLTVLDTALGNTHVLVKPSQDYWKTEVDSSVVKGLIDVPINKGPMLLNLDYLLLPEPDSTAVIDTVSEDADSESIDRLADFNPTDIPEMDANIKEFFVGGRHYGRWYLKTQPLTNGVLVDILDSDLYGLNILGQLQWTLTEGSHLTELLDIKLKSSDVGAIQRGFRLVPLIEGEQLTGDMNVKWLGSPIAFNVDSLYGNLNLRVRDGFLVTEEARALKALGALNFKSVSRRLKLDFSDLYQEGVSFDELRFYSKVEDKILTLTEPMLVDGPGGKFLTSGYTNLEDHSLDMKVAVTLPVTGNLPLVAILAGLSPPVAASIYVTEKLIGDELSRFTSASYSVKGTWEEPDMKLRKAFDDNVDGKTRRSLKDRFLGIFGRGKD